MKYVRILGLLAISAAAFMAFAGSASATTLTLTNGDGTRSIAPVGTHIEATSTNTQLHGTVSVSCKQSIVTGSTTTTGSLTETVKGNITTLDFTECGTDTVSVLQKGTLEVHTKNTGADNTGVLTSNGAEVTIQLHRTILGFPITTHCIYKTVNTTIGEITGSDHLVAGVKTTTATIHANATLPPPTTDGACGEEAVWTGTYTVQTPDHLFVD